MVRAKSAFEIAEMVGSKTSLTQEQRRAVGIVALQSARQDVVQTAPLLVRLQEPIERLEQLGIIAEQGQGALERFDGLRGILEVLLGDPRNPPVEDRATGRVEARSGLHGEHVDQVGPALQPPRQLLGSLEQDLIVRALRDRLKQRFERCVRVVAAFFMDVRERDQLRCLVMRIGHRVRAEA